METCIFCQIITGQIPADKIYEDNDFIAFLDIKPINPGHTLLLPKAHHRNLFDLPSDILARLGLAVQKVGQAVKVGASADGLNIIMNNDRAAGQLVDHAHLHLIPRFDNDGLQPWRQQGNQIEIDLKKLQAQIREQIC